MEIVPADRAEAAALRALHVATWERTYRGRASEAWYIQRLYGHPAHQGAGIGRSLLDASTDGLRRAGWHTATLWVLETDQRARGFYERLGWRRDGDRTIGPPTDIRYRLALR